MLRLLEFAASDTYFTWILNFNVPFSHNCWSRVSFSTVYWFIIEFYIIYNNNVVIINIYRRLTGRTFFNCEFACRNSELASFTINTFSFFRWWISFKCAVFNWNCAWSNDVNTASSSFIFSWVSFELTVFDRGRLFDFDVETSSMTFRSIPFKYAIVICQFKVFFLFWILWMIYSPWWLDVLFEFTIYEFKFRWSFGGFCYDLNSKVFIFRFNFIECVVFKNNLVNISSKSKGDSMFFVIIDFDLFKNVVFDDWYFREIVGYNNYNWTFFTACKCVITNFKLIISCRFAYNSNGVLIAFDEFISLDSDVVCVCRNSWTTILWISEFNGIIFNNAYLNFWLNSNNIASIIGYSTFIKSAFADRQFAQLIEWCCGFPCFIFI